MTHLDQLPEFFPALEPKRCTEPSSHTDAGGQMFLSRGFGCPVQDCRHYAHTEWVKDLSDPVGSGILTCECHSPADLDR